MLRRFCIALAFSALGTSWAHADANRIRFLEGAGTLATLSPEQQAEEFPGYLDGDLSPLAAALPVPPPEGSADAKADLEMFHAINDHPSPERWALANDDDATVFNRFNEQLGIPVDRQHVPTLVRLLNRAATDALAATAIAKKRYARPRPYQVMQLNRVCGMPKAPAPETGSVQGSSYPSGHAVVSWVVALVLSEVSPSSAQAVVSRAVSFGNSRVVCGLHFPSDVEAGHKLAAAVTARLFENAAFVHDLKCARREVEAVQKGERAEDLAACAP